jgi:hypothetical protein
MEDGKEDTGQNAAWWGYVEPTWFQISVLMMSGEVIVVDASSEDTFDHVMFWIRVRKGFLPYQQHLFRGPVDVGGKWIEESCEVSLVVENKVSAMYKVLIACPAVRWEFWDRESRHRGSKGIQRVQSMINVATWAWCRDDVGEFDDVELQELCVMLATDRGWNFDNSSEASHFKIVTAPVLAVSTVALDLGE